MMIQWKCKTRCLNATYFAYQGTFYQQTFRTAMGSPVSVTVANLMMEDVSSTRINSNLSTITSTPLSYQFNSLWRTRRMGSSPSFDTLVRHHPDGSLTTSIYRKRTHTDKYLNFQSHHPLAHKLSVIRTLFSRADSICSSLIERSTEELHITQALR